MRALNFIVKILIIFVIYALVFTQSESAIAYDAKSLDLEKALLVNVNNFSGSLDPEVKALIRGNEVHALLCSLLSCENDFMKTVLVELLIKQFYKDCIKIDEKSFNPINLIGFLYNFNSVNIRQMNYDLILGRAPPAVPENILIKAELSENSSAFIFVNSEG